MIELLYKSQETFFEAGGDQFDNCNAVCMHSGVMRQSLIDVTPFMPVSDFICEYCSYPTRHLNPRPASPTS